MKLEMCNECHLYAELNEYGRCVKCELKEILNKEVSELDLVKAHLAFSYHKYDSFVINWCLCDDTIKELKKLGIEVSIESDYQGDFTRIRW